MPFTVVALALNTALAGIALAQGDENVTVCADVTGAGGLPPLTVTVTLVVPKAESGFTPKTGVVIVRFAAPTEKPIAPRSLLTRLPLWIPLEHLP